MNEALIVFVSLLAIMEPFGVIPVFLSIFGKSKPREKSNAIRNIIITAAILLLLFLAIGTPMLTWLNISLPAFMIAGGILLLIISLDLIHGMFPRSKTTDKQDSAIVPLGTPLLAGPGSITSVIYFTTIYGYAATLIGTIMALVASSVIIFYGSKISKFLGNNGLKILTRIMGLITAAVAISLIEKAMIFYGVI